MTLIQLRAFDWLQHVTSYTSELLSLLFRVEGEKRGIAGASLPGNKQMSCQSSRPLVEEVCGSLWAELVGWGSFTNTEQAVSDSWPS